MTVELSLDPKSQVLSSRPQRTRSNTTNVLFIHAPRDKNTSCAGILARARASHHASY